jgi:hypothetical protein
MNRTGILKPLRRALDDGLELGGSRRGAASPRARSAGSSASAWPTSGGGAFEPFDAEQLNYDAASWHGALANRRHPI